MIVDNLFTNRMRNDVFPGFENKKEIIPAIMKGKTNAIIASSMPFK